MSEPPKWAPLPRAPGRQRRWTRTPPQKAGSIDLARGMRVDELVQLLESLPGAMELSSVQGIGRSEPGKLRFRKPTDG
jgi:hypothetical protein